MSLVLGKCSGGNKDQEKSTSQNVLEMRDQVTQNMIQTVYESLIKTFSIQMNLTILCLQFVHLRKGLYSFK